MINGKHYSWESITVGLPYGIALEIQDISYDDGLEKELVYGKGAAPTGYGTGKYKADAKITVTREEFKRVLEYCKKMGVSLYRLGNFPITISYADDDNPTETDTIKGCSFTKTSHKAKNGDKSLTVDLDLNVSGKIIRNGVEPI